MPECCHPLRARCQHPVTDTYGGLLHDISEVKAVAPRMRGTPDVAQLAADPRGGSPAHAGNTARAAGGCSYSQAGHPAGMAEGPVAPDGLVSSGLKGRAGGFAAFASLRFLSLWTRLPGHMPGWFHPRSFSRRSARAKARATTAAMARAKPIRFCSVQANTSLALASSIASGLKNGETRT
jgi:hypothetical protein